MKRYWIEYTDGTVKAFVAENDKEAFWHVKMEGDHVIDFGEIEARGSSSDGRAQD